MNKFNVSQKLLATAKLNEFYEIFDREPKVLRLAYGLAIKEAKERLNWLAQEAYA